MWCSIAKHYDVPRGIKRALSMKKPAGKRFDTAFVKSTENARIRELNLKLLEACKLEDIDRIKSLVEKGANLHLLNRSALHAYNNNERSPVHIITQIGNLGILEYFIDNGSDCNAKDRRNETPLHLAVYNGYKSIIDFLVSHCQAVVEAKDIDGGTPLSWAAYENQLESAQQLLGLGAHVDEPDYEGRTPLHWAAYRGHEKMVAFLLSSGADSNAITSDGDTPLDIAVNNGRTTVVEFLYQRKDEN